MATRLRLIKVGQRGNINKRRRSSSSTPSPQALAIFRRNGQVQIADGTFNVVGGDCHTHYHFHDIKAELELALRAIPNFRKIHQDTLAKATPGTGMWIFKNEKFRIWLEANGNLKIILGFGIPGAGKTILAAIVIKYLEALSAKAYGGPICVAYVYIRFSDRDQVTVRSVLETFVRQVVERHPGCFSLVEKAYTRHLQEGTEPSEGDLLELLRTMSRRMAATFFILEAIDEASEKIQIDLIKKLASLDVRLFITSRPLQAIEAKLPDAHAISIMAHKEDLDLHIAERFENVVTLHGLQECDPELKQQIVTAVKSKCGEMFLHASLQLDALQLCSSPHDVLMTLQSFPSQIEEVYMQTWNRIVDSTPHHISLAKAALVWVLNAQRSMTIDELRYALATHPVTHNFESTRLIHETTFMAIFRGLIVVDPRSMLVRLVHKTARSPLEKLLSDTFPNPHAHLFEVCVTHLANCGFQDTTITSQEELGQALQADPLLAYAHSSWSYHAQQSLELGSVTIQLSKFISASRAFPVLVYGSSGFDLLGPLHLVALSSLPMVFAGPCDSDNANTPTVVGRRQALGLACWWRGNRSVVQFLLRLSNIFVNATDNSGISALMCAASKGHLDLVEILLTRADIDVNLVDCEGWSALLKAAANGHECVVRRLLAHPEMKLTDTQKGIALTWAAWKGYVGIVKLFLTHHHHAFGVNAVDQTGRTALMCAASGGHETTIDFLLSIPDVDVNLVDNDGWSALMKAAANDRKVTVKLLLAHPGIDTSVADFLGKTALLSACHDGHAEAVDLLFLSLGMDVNPRGEEGNTAMKMAAEDGYGTILGVPGVAGHGEVDCWIQMVATGDGSFNLPVLSPTSLDYALTDLGGEYWGDSDDSDDIEQWEDARNCSC